MKFFVKVKLHRYTLHNNLQRELEQWVKKYNQLLIDGHQTVQEVLKQLNGEFQAIHDKHKRCKPIEQWTSRNDRDIEDGDPDGSTLHAGFSINTYRIYSIHFYPVLQEVNEPVYAPVKDRKEVAHERS